MTLRELIDSFTHPSASGILPPSLSPSLPPEDGRTIDIRIDNPHGVPANYSVARLRPSGRLVPGLNVDKRRVGTADRRTLRVPITDASVDADHLITIRAGGMTSKIVLYRESLEKALEQGMAPVVSVAIAATGAVRFSVR